MIAFGSVLSAVFFGLWGATTLALGLLFVAARLDIISASNRVAMADHQRSLAEQKTAQLDMILRQVLNRPAEAYLKEEQVRQLAQDVYQNVVEIRNRKLGIN